MKIELGLQISEKEYRELPYPSYSLLSGITKSGPDAVHGQRVDISDLDAIIIGSITDSLVTERRLPDNLEVIDKKPAAKALQVIKELCERDDLVDSDNPLSTKNTKIIAEICNKVDYYKSKSSSGKVEVLKKYKKYANALLKHGGNALIASRYQYDQAISLSNALFVRYPYLKDEENIIPQVKIIGEVDGVEIKGMLDFVYIDHVNKVVVPFDLKTGMGYHYDFFEIGYLGWGYYIQASLYKELLGQYLKTHPILKDYTIDNFRFMYCGRQDRLPIVYTVTDKQHTAGFTGFEYKGKEFKGIHELLEEYVYYKQRPNAVYRKGYDADEVVFDDSYL